MAYDPPVRPFEQDQSVDALRESEERFRRILRTTEAGYFCIDCGGHYLDVNDAFLRLHKFSSRDDVIGKHFVITLPESEVEIANEGVARVLAGESIPTGEISRRCADGSIGYHTFSAQPVFQGGEIVGLDGFIIDTTERHRAEAKLRDSQRLLQSTLAALRDAVFIIDDATRNIIDCNPAANAMFGYQQEDMIGQSAAMLHTDLDSRDTFRRLLSEQVEAQGYLHVPEFSMRRKDGSVFPSEHTVVPLRNEAGLRSGWVSAIRDITDRVRLAEAHARLQDQLHQSQKMDALGQLAGGIAHDFANLLKAIFGHTAVARSHLHENHPAAASLSLVEEAARQAGGVTNALLTFSRRMPATKKAVELCSHTQKVMSLIGRMLPSSIEVVMQPRCHHNAWIRGDDTQIQQVILNLALNARDAMPQGGALTISVALEESSAVASGRVVSLSVKDTGVGMSKELCERAFEPFFTTKPQGQGTGLGLAIIHGIVTDHAGEISISSVPDEGTTVCVTFPGLTDEEIPKLPRHRGAGLVLLAESNRHVSSIITSSLRSSGYEVDHVSDLDSLIDAACTARPLAKLCVVDLGDESTKETKWLAALREADLRMPVIIIASELNDSLADLSDEDALVLQKPFQIAEFSALVKSAVIDTTGQQEAL